MEKIDINDISVSSLIRDAGKLEGFSYRNNAAFEARYCDLIIEIEMDERTIIVSDPETTEYTVFHNILPKLFDQFLDGLMWDFEEEEAA